MREELLVIELQHDQLAFTLPDVHRRARFAIEFQRTSDPKVVREFH